MSLYDLATSFGSSENRRLKCHVFRLDPVLAVFLSPDDTARESIFGVPIRVAARFPLWQEET